MKEKRYFFFIRSDQIAQKQTAVDCMHCSVRTALGNCLRFFRPCAHLSTAARVLTARRKNDYVNRAPHCSFANCVSVCRTSSNCNRRLVAAKYLPFALMPVCRATSSDAVHFGLLCSFVCTCCVHSFHFRPSSPLIHI